MGIYAIDESYREKVNQIIKDEWLGPLSVSKGNIIDTSILPGFVFVENGVIKGVITYHISNAECEIVTLNSFEENKGIGTMLINAVMDAAKMNECNRVWLITTNDDINAIRFYQKRNFSLIAVHINAMEKSRVLKPQIPRIGMNDIPILHEFEFEICLT